eukprot:Sspe_Gene.31901::Locus_15676_Transcript_1_1_Confidence_1.000_Length_5095::g.31901::m.31901
MPVFLLQPKLFEHVLNQLRLFVVSPPLTAPPVLSQDLDVFLQRDFRAGTHRCDVFEHPPRHDFDLLVHHLMSSCGARHLPGVRGGRCKSTHSSREGPVCTVGALPLPDQGAQLPIYLETHGQHVVNQVGSPGAATVRYSTFGVLTMAAPATRPRASMTTRRSTSLPPSERTWASPRTPSRRRCAKAETLPFATWSSVALAVHRASRSCRASL